MLFFLRRNLIRGFSSLAISSPALLLAVDRAGRYIAADSEACVCYFEVLLTITKFYPDELQRSSRSFYPFLLTPMMLMAFEYYDLFYDQLPVIIWLVHLMPHSQ
jgi:hypothetical protein